MNIVHAYEHFFITIEINSNLVDHPRSIVLKPNLDTNHRITQNFIDLLMFLLLVLTAQRVKKSRA
jgi:hypothetical protein